MFKNKIVKARSVNVFGSIRKIQLLNSNLELYSWEKYLAVEIEYGENSDTSEFIKTTREKYKKYLDANAKWKSIFSKNEIIELFNNGDFEIIMSKNWRGEVSERDDLALELYEEKTFPLGNHIAYFANIFSKSKVHIFKGGPDNVMGGARPGDHEVWIRKGENEKIIVDYASGQVRIGVALFKIII